MKWKTKKLEELCSVFADGDWIEKKDQSKEGIRLVQTGNIGEGYFKYRGEKARYISDKTFHRLNCTEIVPGDCLISRLPDPVGRSCIIPETKEKMITAVDCTIIRFDNSILPEWFVNYTLSNDYQLQINKEVGGATRQRISRKSLGQVEIPSPSISEQKRIVKILDEAFEKLEKAKMAAEKNLQNSKELFESYLQSVFANPGKDWEEKTLGETCDFYNGKAHEKVIDANGAFIVINSKFIASNGEKYKKTKKVLFPLVENDIVMVMSDVPNGKALAKCFIVDKDNTYSLNQRICAIRSKVFQTRFLYLQLNRHKYLLDFNNGENQTNLRKNDILNCPLFVPPISVQKNIITKLDALSAETKKLETIYKQKLSDIEELKKSILKKAFSGEL